MYLNQTKEAWDWLYHDHNHKTLIINLTYLSIAWPWLWPSAITKKSSTSAGAKKEICLLLKAKFCSTLCFFGAGGHVSISGIRDFLDIGVQHPLGDVDVAVEDIEVDDDVEVTSLLIVHGEDRFLILSILLVGVPLIGFFPFDTIFKTKLREKRKESVWIYIYEESIYVYKP